MESTQTAVLGAGVIGMSWTALFAAAGHPVAVYEPRDGAEDDVRRFIQTAAPALEQLGFAKPGDDRAVTLHPTPEAAVDGATIIQENAPEKLEVKHALYGQIAPALGSDALLLTSTSGLTLAALQEGLPDPSRLLLAHPFNPPHLIPLVELMANEATAPDVLPRASAFYESLGKTTITLRKGVPGHVANRLQAVLWQEAIHLAREGVASLADIDKAIATGPGLRWGIFGPSLLFTLAGGPGGMRSFVDHLAPGAERWWTDSGNVTLDDETKNFLVEEMAKAMDGRPPDAFAAERDQVLLDFLSARKRAGLE